jgi:hypothetical protein
MKMLRPALEAQTDNCIVHGEAPMPRAALELSNVSCNIAGVRLRLYDPPLRVQPRSGRYFVVGSGGGARLAHEVVAEAVRYDNGAAPNLAGVHLASADQVE